MSSNIPNEIEQATRQLQADVKITHDVTHGDENTEIAVDSGTIPTLRKRLKDIEQDWAQTADPLAADLASTVQVTKGYKDAAAQSASDAAAELSKVQDEGDAQTGNVNNAGTAQVQAVNDAGVSQTSTVNQAGATQLQTVNQAGIDNLKSVNDAGVAQTGAVNDAGTARLQEITEAGKTAEQAADETKAIADQFGDVAGVVDEATQQADRSKSEADRSTAQANVSTSGGNKAKVEADRAKAEADRATAIVHNDEGSTTSKPGAYPVADSNGHLDIGWTPLLQAMYPYSGVIGDTDKGRLFITESVNNTNSYWSNRIRMLNRQYNIAGRFVDFQQIDIVFQEAESTADRAIAFDDIFLDWNGNIQTYRSITPHRTTTGYDRDAIATEHGYSKVQTGLYKTGDTYALLLGRVTRRNQGAYHPVFNPEGTASIWSATAKSTHAKWFNSFSKQPANYEDLFTFANHVNDYKEGISTRPFLFPKGSSGGIANTESYLSNLRPDNKRYDAIYADDFTPLYYSAKNVIDRQALLFDSFNRAVAGETFSGAEGTAYLPELINQADYSATEGLKLSTPSGGIANGIVVSQSTIEMNCSQQEGVYIPCDLKEGDVIELQVNVTSLSVGTINIYFYAQGANDQYITISSTGKLNRRYKIAGTGNNYGRDNFFAILGSTTNTVAIISELSVKVHRKQPSARPQFLMVDIIGSLNAMPDEWKTNGIPGNWLAVGEEGESLIPDGTSKNFKLSRKCLECYQVLWSDDKGVTWTDATNIWKPNLESASNSYGGVPAPATRIYMIFYRTSANPFELADNAIGITHPEYCHFAADNGANYGSLYISNLINKVCTGGYHRRGKINAFSYYTSPLLEPQRHPTHLPFDSFTGETTTPFAKVLPYISAQGAMHLIYQEIKHNGTQWGDDNKFNIVDNQSTVTDLNGETVIVGQKRLELPYHFDGVQY